MQKFRMISDLHLECKGAVLFNHVLPEDKDTILILAGDVCEVKRTNKMREQLVLLCERFLKVIHVEGNHEKWNGSLIRTTCKLRELMKDVYNYHLLDNEYIELDDVIIMGCTLWTDMNNGDPVFMAQVPSLINDYKKIRTGTNDSPYTRRILPVDIMKEHLTSKKFLDETLEQFKHKRRMVVTHHSPIFDCLDKKFSGETSNYAYSSVMIESDIIVKHQPDIWIHGHVHKLNDFKKHGTRFICNPIGYPCETTQFDPNFTFNL